MASKQALPHSLLRTPRRYPRSLSAHRAFSATAAARADYTHIVIGGGVVGLATARALAAQPGTRTALLERHGQTGTETSSRNSEVIHAGLYYPVASLKTRLCLAGKAALYALCEQHNLPHRRVGKWIVAQDREQRAALEKLASHAAGLDVPVRWVSADEATAREPTVRGAGGILESPSTGIVDAHALMGFLQEDLAARGGDVAVQSAVTGLRRDVATGEFEIDVADASGNEPATVRAETVVNAAGLGAVAVSNMLLPEARRRKAFFAKGTYFAYSAPSPRPGILVYPAPTPGAAGLGTHLTLDLADPPGVRFGPDVEWIDDPTAPDALAPSEARLPAALDAIATYLPGLQRGRVRVDYCGIRPKLSRGGAVGGGAGFQDFVIQIEDGFDGFVNLLGIESPGLTSSLAIADEVVALLYPRARTV